MFWDKVAGIYDLVETVYNGRVYKNLGKRIAKEMEAGDVVLECACGTGAISRHIAPTCKLLIATDFSGGMLRQAAKNCRNYDNVRIRRADMMKLKCRDNRFNKVVAGNVIHLLEKPEDAEGFFAGMIMDAMEVMVSAEGDLKEMDEKILEQVNRVALAAEELYKDLRRKVTPEELAAETDLTVGEIEEAYRLSGEQIDTIEINLSDRQ